MIAVRTIATEHVNFEALLERFEIINFRPDDLPKRFDVALQWFGFRQRWPKVPRIFKEAGRVWLVALAFAMNMRWLDGEPLTDLIKKDVVSVNTQRRAEVEVVRVVRLFATERTSAAFRSSPGSRSCWTSSALPPLIGREGGSGQAGSLFGCRCEQPRPHFLWKIHGLEAIGWVEIILSGFIDNPKTTNLGGLRIR